MSAHEVKSLRVETTDVDQAAEAISASFPGLTLAPDEDGAPFHFTHSRVADDFFSVNQLSLHGRARSRGSFPDLFGAGRVLSGSFAVEYGSVGIDTATPYLRPAGWQVAEFEDAHLEYIAVDSDQFAREAAKYLAGTGQRLRPVSVENAKAVSDQAVLLWHSTADHITNVARDPALFALPVVRATLVDLYVMTMLRVFPVTRDSGWGAGIAASPRALRRAVLYMEDHLQEPITVALIANAARLSVRGLQNMFASQLGTTPTRLLRELRLRAAHDEILTSASSGGTRISEVAHR